MTMTTCNDPGNSKLDNTPADRENTATEPLARAAKTRPLM